MHPKLTFIILTYNEEQRLSDCLDSLDGMGARVFVADSYSTDGTLDILARRGITFVQHEFGSYGAQRNWAQQNNPFGTEWVFHLDADERLSVELRAWLKDYFPREAVRRDGFMFSRRTYFLGRWIRFGGVYPIYHLRLFKATKGHCELKAYDQHFVVDGPTIAVPGRNIIDTNAASISDFTASHNRWSSMEAGKVPGQSSTGEVMPRLAGTPIERRRWLKANLYGRAPLLWRASAYFLYRYFVLGGFLDGREGLIYHFLQGFWFRFLIDAKIIEIQRSRPGSTQGKTESMGRVL